MSRELEWSLPQGLDAPMQCCVLECGQSVVTFLHSNSQEALATARLQLARLGGLCRILGARRAALFCTELDGLLLCFSSGGAQSVRMLLGRSVVQLQHFLARSSHPASDEEFDMARINALRTARGKLALPVDTSCCDPSCRDPSCCECLPVGSQFPLPDFLLRVLEKIATLQAGLNRVEETPDAHAQREHSQHLAELASLLEVCGLPLEMRCLPTALVHLEMHFRYLSEHCQPCTPGGLAQVSRLDASDYLLVSGRRSVMTVLYGKFNVLVHSLAEIVNGNSAEHLPQKLGNAAKEVLHTSESIRLLARNGLAALDSHPLFDLMQKGDGLCRQLHCRLSDVYSAPEGVQAGALLLMRVLLLAQKMLDGKTLHQKALYHKTQDRNDRRDRHVETLFRKICRDCARFVSTRKRELSRHMVAIHRVDDELLACANSEIEHYVYILTVCLDESRSAHGIHYISETLCTTVSKLALALLSAGQTALHEIVEDLRASVTLGLEQQQRTGPLLHDVLASLCGLLQRPLPMDVEEIWPSDKELQQFSELVDDWLIQTKWSLSVGDSAVFVVFHSENESENRARISVEQLPVHLASNIRDLLFCAEELTQCAGHPVRFEALNRRLIVELRMLATGARALRVHRVAHLSAVLAEVHQALAGLNAELLYESDNAQQLPLTLLMMAHRQLRTGLNQAAARQEVASNQEIIAAMYQWLEDNSRQVSTSRTTEGFAIFLRESEEIMAAIDEGARKPPEDWNTRTLLHHLHTLKGNARQFSCDGIATLCHRCEEALLFAAHPLHSSFLPSLLPSLHPSLRPSLNSPLHASLHSSCHSSLHGPLAVAESAGGIVYPPHTLHTSHTLHTLHTPGLEVPAVAKLLRFSALAQELRAAIDALTSVGNPLDGSVQENVEESVNESVEGRVKKSVKKRGSGPVDKPRLPRIPLAVAQERSVVIPAISLQRMADLAVAARTGSRAMSDVLQSCRLDAEPARLTLLRDLLVEQERCTVQLDEEIAGSRQISFARLTPRLQRLADRHANLLDKQLRFSVRNDALRADRLLVESLVAPLEHLLRNAIDHGIESVPERRARGKPDSGTITLTLEASDDAMTVTLTDDGAGIDPDALAAHVTRLELPVDLQADEKARMQWIFLPGFSSRELVTEDAGHGIGLAAVRSTISALGGRIEVDSTPGQGSCFRIVLPR